MENLVYDIQLFFKSKRKTIKLEQIARIFRNVGLRPKTMIIDLYDDFKKELKLESESIVNYKSIIECEPLLRKILSHTYKDYIDHVYQAWLNELKKGSKHNRKQITIAEQIELIIGKELSPEFITSFERCNSIIYNVDSLCLQHCVEYSDLKFFCLYSILNLPRRKTQIDLLNRFVDLGYSLELPSYGSLLLVRDV